jgi:hypothetical protein
MLHLLTAGFTDLLSHLTVRTGNFDQRRGRIMDYGIGNGNFFYCHGSSNN